MITPLFCPDCRENTMHNVYRWQTAPDQFGGLTVGCLTCSRLILLDISLDGVDMASIVEELQDD